MASAKQIKARKLFAKRVKRGDFKKAIAKTKKAKVSTEFGVSTKSKRFSISSSERKQTKNLNVYSPPPESYTTVTGTAQAKKIAKEKRKMYAKVKIWKIKE